MRYRWNNYCTVNLIADKYDEIEVYNYLIEETFRLPTDIVMWAQQLDGKTSPYDIDKSIDTDTVRYLLTILENYDGIRKSRFLLKSFSQTLFSLYIPSKITTGMKIFARVYNSLLLLLFLPILLLGIFCFCTNLSSLSSLNEGFYIGVVVGLIIGIILHEVAHAAATLSYKGNLFEMGIGFSSFLPIGYALIDTTPIKSKLQRVQVNLAGIEANLLICGLSLILAIFFNTDIFLGVAIQNIFLALLNLVFKNGVDGCSAISELLGDRSLTFVSKVNKIVWNKKKRQQLLSKGLHGYAIFSTACIFQLLKLTLPALSIYNILNLIEVFL